MTMRMLIDARHLEETRVAVVKGSRIEEFDFESAEHKQLKGNIYLAKVTRVEPSLQAAFIDYGGNRHGFLAFSEIHPDYYQIPREDREALLREEAEHAAEEERLRGAALDSDDDPELSGDVDDGFVDDEPIDDDEHHAEFHGEDADAEQLGGEEEPVEGDEESVEGDAPQGDRRRGRGGRGGRGGANEAAADELRRKRQNLRRRYKIQDVIQRRQVLLVQVVKEERGNKGAALTTYLSLAGRYCVLMPNTSHGGGISRKISNGADRKRLKSIMADLKLPTSMGLIVRTAGLQRNKIEIKRDFDYLARLWDEVRENTLGSSAPALIYRDSDLVKRAIRDLYHREIDEVIVEGEAGFKAARGYMKLLMPSHVRRVRHHAEATPLFQQQGVEDQLNAMYQPVVQLKSGGYLVINPTEALVSIDINSGRSTREHNIEQTAYATNIEAATEIARQLRLRDMAGLVVIDFIDMEQGGHVRKVERAMKDALKNDRARIQVGRISSFGLMEMSRQRLRTGVLEASTRPCAHCDGSGLMRTASSAGLSALRMLEDEAARGRGEKVCLRAGREAAIYVLNKKRAELAEIEARYGVTVEVLVDESFEGARMSVESSGPRPVAPIRPAIAAPLLDDADFDEEEDEEFEEEDEVIESEERPERSERGPRQPREAREPREPREARESREAREPRDTPESSDSLETAEGEEGTGRRRRRRRRGGRGRNRGENGELAEGSAQVEGDDGDETFEADASRGELDEANDEIEAVGAEPRDGDAPEGDDTRRPRRGRRGGRRRRGGEREGGEAGEATAALPEPDDAPMREPVPSRDPSPDRVEPAPVAKAQAVSPDVDEDEIDEDSGKPKARRRPRSRKAAAEAEAAPKARATSRAKAAPAVEAEAPASEDAPTGEDAPAGEDAKPKRRARAKKVVDTEVTAEVPKKAPARSRSRAAPPVVSPEPTSDAAPERSSKRATSAPAAAAEDGASSKDGLTSKDGAGPDDGSGGDDARRGWWQRTFG